MRFMRAQTKAACSSRQPRHYIVQSRS